MHALNSVELQLPVFITMPFLARTPDAFAFLAENILVCVMGHVRLCLLAAFVLQLC